MSWSLDPERFALVGFPEEPCDQDLELLTAEGPCQLIREGGESTMLVKIGALAGVRARHQLARVQAPLVWIRFELGMDWELVGFLAHVSSALGARGVPLGAVCGYSRDHLFVAERFLSTTLEVLAELFPERS